MKYYPKIPCPAGPCRLGKMTAMALIGLSAFTWLPEAQAAVQISTLGESTQSQLGIRNAISNPGDPQAYSLAMAFTTGDDIYTLDAIRMSLGVNSQVENHDFVFTIHAVDANLLPTGPALSTLVYSGFSTLPTYTNTVLTPSATFMLAANTTYSIVASPPPTGINVLGMEVSNPADGYTFNAPGWSYEVLAVQIDSGPWASLGSYYFKADIEATAIPEPSTYLLMGLSLGGVFLMRWRRLHRSATAA